MNDKITFAANELFRTICKRDPTNLEISLFDKLIETSKVPKQTSITVSSKYRADLCHNNSKAADFEKTYQQLNKANIKELDPLITVLHCIKKSPIIIDMLNDTYIPLESSYETIGNQSNSEQKKLSKNTPDNSSSAKSDIPSSVNSLSSSPFYGNDFVDLSSLMLPPFFPPPIKSLDKQSQEKALIRDLLNCLMGNHGLYIQALPLTSTTLERQFKIDDGMYPGFLDTVKIILVTCSHMSTVLRFTDEYYKYEYGNVNQALASAIDSQIRDFRLLTCQIEELFLSGNLSLSALRNHIERPSEMIRCIANICQDIMQSKSRGGAVLSMFYHHGLSIGNPKEKALINHLMKCSTVPFFRILKIWIFRGIISDPYQEFFIRGKSSDKPDQNYWTKNYTIVEDLVPKFLRMHVQKILNTGKYLNVIQLCGSDADFHDIEEMEYENEDQHFVLQIDRAHQHASKLLLDILFKDNKLLDHLQIMKHYFLLDEADWLNHFMYSANDELNEKVSECQRGRLESLLDVAIQTGNITGDTLHENITVELSNQELIPFIYNIMKYDPRKGSRMNTEALGRNLRVLEAFSLGYKSDWPISLVLNTGVIQRYQILFRHVFYCHHVGRVLLGVRASGRASGERLGSRHIVNKACILGNSMCTFIQQLVYYMTTEVIEPFWRAFRAGLDKAQNLDQVLEQHEQFLEACLHNCLGSSTQMLKSLQKMMVLCVNYANRFNRLSSAGHGDGDPFNEAAGRQSGVGESRCYDAQSFEKIIDQDEATFMAIAREFIADIRADQDNKMLIKLVDRLEFNDHYGDSAQESDVDC